jgi:hypothetical protein
MKWLSVLVLLLSVVLMMGIGGRMSFACDHSTQGTQDGGESSVNDDSNGSNGASSAGSVAGSSGMKSGGNSTGPDAAGNRNEGHPRYTREPLPMCDYWDLPWCPDDERSGE